jgi:cytochrome P450
MTQLDIDRFDPTDISFYSQPQAWYPGLLERGVFHHETAGESYSIFGFEDVRSGLLDWETFSNTLAPEAQAFMSAEPEFVGLLDPPEQRRLRILMGKAMPPRWLRSVQKDMERDADQVVEEAIERREVDFVDDVTKKFVGKLIVGRIHGLPPESAPYYFDLARRIVGAFGWASYLPLGTPIATAKAAEAEQGHAEFMEHIAPIVASRRQDPGDDLISRLIHAEVEGNRLTSREVEIMARDLNLGALDTTAATAAALALRLQQNPDQDKLLRAEPELVSSATEEALRMDGSARQSFRRATRDVEIQGVKIPEGADVSLWTASANVDPVANPEPQAFRLRRENRQHLAFSFGSHTCPGARLARMEMTALWSSLVAKTSSIEIDEARIEWYASPHIQGPLHMPARLVAA